MATFDPRAPGRYESVFIGPSGQDALLACPGRIQSEVEKGRRTLVLALFEPTGWATRAAEAARLLGADYAAAGLRPVRERRHVQTLSAIAERVPEDDAAVLEAARLLADCVPQMQSVNVFAPLGVGASADHRIAYEAAVRGLAMEAGRNLFLYEERPEAFVPGAVRTRLALLGARLPPEAQKAVERTSLLRHLFSLSEPRRLRGEAVRFGESLAALAAARRRYREARPWNPLRALGPRLQPLVYVADEQAMRQARSVAESLLPRDAAGRTRAANRFSVRAASAAKKLGGIYHAERYWLFLPSGEGLPEIQHPMELSQA